MIRLFRVARSTPKKIAKLRAKLEEVSGTVIHDQPIANVTETNAKAAEALARAASGVDNYIALIDTMLSIKVTVDGVSWATTVTLSKEERALLKSRGELLRDPMAAALALGILPAQMVSTPALDAATEPPATEV